MKKIILAIFAMSVAAVLAETVHCISLTPAATSVNASTTNSTAGTAADIPGGCGAITLYATATGVAGTANGDLVIKFQISSDGTTWTDAATSPIKLTIDTLGATNITVSDWFVVEGAKQIRVGQMENTFTGAVSALAFKMTAIGQ